MARKFKFKLAPVLKYRELIEDQKKSRFAHAQSIRNAKLSEIEDLANETTSARQSMAEASQGMIDVSQIRNMNRYITGLGVSSRQRAGELRAIEAEVEKRRIEFVEARKETHVLEKVKEKQKEAHEYEEMREQTNVFDEMAGQKAARELIKRYSPRQADEEVYIEGENERVEGDASGQAKEVQNSEVTE